MRKWLVKLRGSESQQSTAKKLGISQSFYAALETGARRPSPELAKSIASALGIEWTRFYEEEMTDGEKGA